MTVRLPDPGSHLGNGGLPSVTASSPASVWAVGSVGGTTSVLHWNGTSWTPETTPAGPDGQPCHGRPRCVPQRDTTVPCATLALDYSLS